CFIHTGCSNSGNTSKPPEMSAAVSDYGQTAEGPAKLYTLKNQTGMQVEVTNYGGIITRLSVPDKNGQSADVVLGFDNLQDYQNDHPYFGAIIGRYGNRIAKGKFTLDGQEYTLAANNGPNTLHGGPTGFHKHLWQATEIHREGYTGLELSRLSQDMEEGYPGNLNVTVTYSLTEDNLFDVEYSAFTDKKTVINLTQHAYFNLSGDFKNTIHDHEVQILADHYLPMNEESIPIGKMEPVDDSPFDFRRGKRVCMHIDDDHQQLKLGNGYDHCWVLNGNHGDFRKVAEAWQSGSGRRMEVFSTEPGIQLYTGNYLNEKEHGKIKFGRRSGFCFETQHFPDSPNQPGFPSVVLHPGEQYYSKTAFKFSVK
ncbi:MAG: galactose mutarotase, partial [Flavobacteriaceae bacterium]|nr:galactose mutarotase [Flavobacteriaceae bacterium]